MRDSSLPEVMRTSQYFCRGKSPAWRAVLRTALRPLHRARSPWAAHVHGGGAARSRPAPLPARLRRDGGVKPLQTTPTYRYRISDSHGRGRSTSPMGIRAAALPHSQTWARKGSMAQCVIDPQSSLVLLLARRVNSAAGERGLRRSAMRNYSAPVVTACSIDPPTRTERTSFALRLRLRRRSLLAARPSACADTRAPSACFHAQAC